MTKWTDPHDTPNCEGKDPVLFDDPEMYSLALAICKDCPVRFWCLNTVDPAPSFYDGVAGGHAWRDGVPLPRYTDLKDPVLQTYLGKRRAKKQLTMPDQQAVRQFLVGKLTWNKLTKVDRYEAVRVMHRQGTPPTLASDLTHLDIVEVLDIYNQQDTTSKR